MERSEAVNAVAAWVRLEYQYPESSAQMPAAGSTPERVLVSAANWPLPELARLLQALAEVRKT